MDCSFTGTPSRRSIAKSSKAACKIRQRKLAAAAEAASLQIGEEASNVAVVQAADKEGRLDAGHGSNMDGECHTQDIGSSTTITVQPDDGHRCECQYPVAREAKAEVKCFLLFSATV
jgi:hypothetical protein